MQLNRKTVLLAALLSGVALLGPGCSGINASKSVSPATFLFPGLFGQTQPASDAPPVSAETVSPSQPVQTFAPAD